MVKGTAPGFDWEREMIARPNSNGDYAVLAVSLGLAAVFIYAGFEKLHDPLDFADSIAGFGILPRALINPFALALPPFEIACGLLLLWPPTRRVGALAIAVLSVMFFAALLSALLRGLTLDCGCFGTWSAIAAEDVDRARTERCARRWLSAHLSALNNGVAAAAGVTRSDHSDSRPHWTDDASGSSMQHV